MIIVGLNRVMNNVFVYNRRCEHCRRTTAHALRRAVTTLTVFFIPLLPVRTRYSSQCTCCGAEGHLDRQQAARLRTAPQRDTGNVPTFR